MTVESICKAVKKSLAVITYRTLAQLIRPWKPRHAVPPQSTAIIFLGALGDFFVFCGAAEELYKKGLRLTLICTEKSGVAGIAPRLGLFEEVIALPIGFSKRIANLRVLRNIEAELVFPAPLGRHALPDLYTMAVRARKRVLPDMTQDCISAGLKEFFDRQTDVLVPITAECELDRYTQFFCGSGILSVQIRPYKIGGPPVEKKNRIAVFPGTSGGREKCWPAERFAWVLRHLYAERPAEILILGTAADNILGQALADFLQGIEPTRNLCGKTSIPETLELLKTCQLVLANDSGGSHMAMACDVPTVVVGGHWQYGRIYPHPYLPPHHQVVTAGSEWACHCGESKPACRNGTGAAPCVLAVEKELVLKTAKSVRKGDGHT